jgi:hypothetical protein
MMSSPELSGEAVASEEEVLRSAGVGAAGVADVVLCALASVDQQLSAVDASNSAA